MSATNFSWRAPIQRLMNVAMAVILQEPTGFSFQILRVPKEGAVKVFPPNGSNPWALAFLFYQMNTAVGTYAF